MRCQARQYSDQMSCAACGLVWDTNDPDPPECRDGVRALTTAETTRKDAQQMDLFNEVTA